MLTTLLTESIKKLGLMPGINTKCKKLNQKTTEGETNLAREKVSERLCPALEQDREQEGQCCVPEAIQ